MTEPVLLGDGSRAPKFAVTVSEGAVSVHAGVVYTLKGKTAILHLVWDHLLLNENPKSKTDPRTSKLIWAFMPPGIDEEDLKVLADACSRVWRKRPDIAFGFRNSKTAFVNDAKKEPDLQLGAGETGLTCGTFVLTLFEYAQVPLLQRDTWEVRPGDRPAYETILKELRKDPKVAKDHITALEKETGSVRYRPEEVAVASSFTGRPVTFALAKPAGEGLCEKYYELVSATTTGA